MQHFLILAGQFVFPHSKCTIMKKYHRIVLFILIIQLFTACAKQKSDVSYDYNCVKGKLLRVNCEGYTIQVLKDNLEFGVNDWEDRNGSLMNPVTAIYNNVFLGINKCDLDNEVNRLGVKVDDIFFFSVKKLPSDYTDNSGCILCNGFESDQPSVRAIVGNISKDNCNISK